MGSLFTNAPLEETIIISCDSLFGNEAKINNYNRNDFGKLLRMALQNNFFNSDGNCVSHQTGLQLHLKFFEKKFLHTPVTLTVEKKELFIVLPHLRNLSLALRTHLHNSNNKNLLFCKIKVTFKSTTRLSNFFLFKDKVSFNLRSNVVYKFLCGRCNTTYYGETCRHLNVRVSEHSGISPLTGKKSKAKTTTAVKDHMFFCDHIVSLDNFKFWQVVIQNFALRSKKVF